jgi:hypothetical protein
MPRGGSDMPVDSAESAADLRAMALRVRLHAITLPDQEAAEKLRSYADELEDQAAALDGE